MRVEKRKSDRLKIKGGKAKCYSQDTRGTYNIIDVSEHGVCLEEGRHLKNRSFVTLKMQWSGIGKGRARGKVVRNGKKIGVKFVEVDDQAKALIDLLRERNAWLKVS